MRHLLLIGFLLTGIFALGQTKTIAGRVIDEFDLAPIPEVRIQNSDTLLLGTTDKNGEFKIELPTDQHELLLSWIGMEWTSIKLSVDCDTVEVIILAEGTYDYNSSKKVDQERKKRFNELPVLHSRAIAKGVFTNTKICYERSFSPYKPRLDEIEKELMAKRKRIKESFSKLEVGDTIKIPYNGSYGSDGTGRATLNVYSYVVDGDNFECLIEGVVMLLLTKERTTTLHIV